MAITDKTIRKTCLTVFTLFALLAPFAAARCPAAASESGAAGNKVERRLYACLDGYVAVYDIDDGHKLIKMLNVTGQRPPERPAGVRGAGVFRGICADPKSGRLYVTHNLSDDVICYDLVNDKVLWKNRYGNHVDSQAITPDGKLLYIPCRGDTHWWVVDAQTGDAITKIDVGTGPHNTNCVGDGSRMYLQTLSQPFVFVADTKTHELVGKIGPFSNTVRPFSVSPDEKYVFACVNGLLGFEVGDIASRKMVHRAEAKTPDERVKQLGTGLGQPHGCPSHGVGLRPDGKEVWVVNGTYGYLHVFDVTGLPDKAPTPIADVPLFAKPEDRPEPGWVCFSLDGRYAYAPGDAVVDTETKKVVARIPTSEKMIEIDFQDGRPVRAARRMW